MASSPLTYVDLDSSWKCQCYSLLPVLSFTFSDPQCRIETSSEATVRTRKKINIARGAKAVEPVRKFPQRAIGASVDVTSKPKDEAETYRVM